MFRILRIVSICLIIISILAVGSLPYVIYTLLRLIVCATSIYGAYLSKKQGNKNWLWIFIVLAVLFNPLIPFYLGLPIWILVDIAAVVLLSVSIKKIKE